MGEIGFREHLHRTKRFFLVVKSDMNKWIVLRERLHWKPPLLFCMAFAMEHEGIRFQFSHDPILRSRVLNI